MKGENVRNKKIDEHAMISPDTTAVTERTKTARYKITVKDF